MVTGDEVQPADQGDGDRRPDGHKVESAPALNPIDTSSIIPQDMEDFPGAGTRVNREELDEQRPLTIHEALARVPGVVTTTDDGSARHSGIGIRGSNFRRSRKVLVLEDGQSINFASYIDPSTHYTPPAERIENIEVLRGFNTAYAPLTNHGVVNFQNLNPFGEEETVIKAALGTNDSNSRHVHTRQRAGNFGAVLSYSGAEGDGVWNSERLRYNDLYGALGWEGTNQDLTASFVYFRQRDNYDESNFEGTEAEFFANRREKLNNLDIFGGGIGFNVFEADHYITQLIHNLYIDPNATLSTKLYGHNFERNRFISQEGGPEAENGFMASRQREYKTFGIDSRIEVANIPLVNDITFDIQTGVNFEMQKFDNCNGVGQRNEVLDFESGGSCFVLQDVSEAAFDAGMGGYRQSSIYQKYDAHAFTAFFQTAIHPTKKLTVVPGIRYVDYDVSRNNIFEALDGDPPPGLDGSVFEDSSHEHVLPGMAVSLEIMPKSTLYGGYNRGFTPAIARGEVFPLPNEVGDTYQVGVRSNALRGLTFDAALFHSDIEEYQIKEAFTDAAGNNVFGVVEEAQFKGLELYSRLDSAPLVGGPWNIFGEAVYTYTDSEITESQIALEVGKNVPQVMVHFANLTAGLEHESGFNASVTLTHRGEFYTDTVNTPYAGDPEGETGLVPDVWLLSARANLKVAENATIFVSGANLKDRFYISDREDGLKPGQGRTVMGGLTLKLN